MLLDFWIVDRVWFVSLRLTMDELDELGVHFEPITDYAVLVIVSSPEWMGLVRVAGSG